MSCSQELKELLRDAEKAPKSEYQSGYLDALREAVEIAEEHEEGE